MSVKGLDVGTAFIVCQEEDATGKIHTRSQRDAFFEVTSGEMTKNALNENETNYVKMGDKLYVVGDDAMEFAEAMGSKARRPLSQGFISPREPEALAIIKKLIAAVLDKQVGPPPHKVVFSVPAEPIDDESRRASLTYHRGSLTTILEQLGYEPIPLTEGLAVAYSELREHHFTGIAISWGAGMINVATTYNSVTIPELTFALARGGDWIDESVAAALEESVAVVCGVKENKDEFSLATKYSSGIPQALSIYYDALVRYAFAHVANRVKGLKRRFVNPMPIVVSGGTTSPPGFDDLVRRVVAETAFSNYKGDKFLIGDVFRAKKPLLSVAGGCLIKGIVG
jgi:hypothetical protein